MSDLDGVVPITVSATTQTPTAAAFDTELIISGSTSSTWVTAELVRTYTSTTAVGVDFTTATPEYLSSVAYFAQTPTPAKVKIGRLTVPCAQMADVAAVTAVNSTDYKFTMGGSTPAGVAIPTTEILYTSDSSATVAEIATGLASAVTTAALTGITASNVSNACRIVGTAGTWLWVRLTSTAGVSYGPEKGGLNLLSLAMVGAEPATSMATQLTAIQAQDSDWFMPNNPYHSLAVTEAIAAWVATQPILYVQSVPDTAVSTHVKSGATDVAAAIQALANQNAGCFYHTQPAQFADSAECGRNLSVQPGFDDWALKSLELVTADSLTDTQITNLRAKSCQYYTSISGIGATDGGYVSTGAFIAYRRGVYKLVQSLQLAVFTRLINANKTPMNNAGLAIIAAAIRKTLDGFEGNVISGDPTDKYVVTVPKKSDILAADIAAGTASGFKINAVGLIGIHKVPITLFVTL